MSHRIESHRIEIYLDQVMKYAGLPDLEGKAARDELTDHLYERIADLEQQGATQDDAVFRAVYDHGLPSDVGYGLRPRFPWVDVRLRGTARGILAIGPRAVGIVACGFVSTGVVSCGVISFGIVSFGMLAFGLALGLGAIAVATVAFGMNVLGLLANDLNAVGVVCVGTNALGVWVSKATNAVSYFDSQNVPGLLEQAGCMLDWNTHDIMIGIFPVLAIWIGITVVAIALVRRESLRIGAMKSWGFR